MVGGEEEVKRVRRLLARAMRRLREQRLARRPEHHADLRFGSGWHRRNFLAEVLIPSLFSPREGEVRRPDLPPVGAGKVRLLWIGHASFLVQTERHNVLIDPNWARWLKVVKRLKHPGIPLGHLPEIDLVLVSHAHFDHLDKRTLRAVANAQPIVVPRNVGSLVHGMGFECVRELGVWESVELDGLVVTLTPAFHWGARMLHDSHRGFGGFLIEYGGRCVFHAGDTAYFDRFREIGRRANIEVALLPIGAYDNLSRRDLHMTPEQAAQAFVELGARTLVPMHYGTFRLSFEPLEEPPRRLLECARRMGIEERVRVLTEGVPVEF